MPTPTYISIEGAAQGNITAGSFTTESIGKQEHFFTTTLTDAIIVTLDFEMPHAQDSASE